MNLVYLKTFKIVAENSSFAKAAALLYISQPAVSQQIKKLENELGFALFERSSHSVKLTPAGNKFLKGTSEILKTYEKTLRDCRSAIPGEGIIHVYFVGYMNYSFLPEILRIFQNEHPQCNIESTRLTPGEAITRMRNGEEGFFFVPECILPFHKNMQTLSLFEDIHYVVMRKGNPLDTGRSIELTELSGIEICLASPQYRPSHMDATIRKLTALEQQPIINEALGVDNTLPLLLFSDAVAIMPGYAVPFHPDIVSAVLNDDVTIPVVIANVGPHGTMYKYFSDAVLTYSKTHHR